MNRVCLSSAVWGDPRFVSLQETTKWGRAETVGTLVLLWEATRRKDSPRAYVERELMAQLIGSESTRHKTLKALMETGYVCKEVDGTLTLPDNVQYHRHIEMLKEAGRRGGMANGARSKALPKPRAKKPRDENGDTPERAAARRATEAAYRDAFVQRYRVAPPMNEKMRRHIGDFVRRVGQAESPDVIRFFVLHPNGFYLKRQHNLELAVKDAEGLLTQWKRGEPITDNDVKSFEAADRLASQVGFFQSRGKEAAP